MEKHLHLIVAILVQAMKDSFVEELGETASTTIQVGSFISIKADSSLNLSRSSPKCKTFTFLCWSSSIDRPYCPIYSGTRGSIYIESHGPLCLHPCLHSSLSAADWTVSGQCTIDAVLIVVFQFTQYPMASVTE